MRGAPISLQEIDDLIDRWDYTTTSGYWYHGHASPNSSESALVWRIKKIQIVNNRPVWSGFVNGNANFSAAWASRASYSYS